MVTLRDRERRWLRNCRSWEATLNNSSPVLSVRSHFHIIIIIIILWITMEQNNQNLTEINRKRKFQAEQLGLPIPKHKCCDRTFPSDEPIYKLNQDDKVFPDRGKMERLAMDDGSEAESVIDSNSSVGDYDSKTSIYSEAKIEPEYGKPSTSFVNYGSDSFKDTNYFSDSLTVANASSSRDETTSGSEVKTFHKFEDDLLEFETLVDYTNSRYGDDSMEQSPDNELDDILYSDESNRNLYMLSSGSLSVVQEAQSGSRKPTIDQEFEQYFSSLML